MALVPDQLEARRMLREARGEDQNKGPELEPKDRVQLAHHIRKAAQQGRASTRIKLNWHSPDVKEVEQFLKERGYSVQIWDQDLLNVEW